MTVYLLWHVHVASGGKEDEKLIGVYSSEAKAEAALARARGLRGFCEHEKGFEICAYEVDKDHWTEGFVGKGK